MIDMIISLAILILLIADVIFNIRLMQHMRRDKDNIYVNCLDRFHDCVHHAGDSFACQKREIRIKGGECKSYQSRSQKPAGEG